MVGRWLTILAIIFGTATPVRAEVLDVPPVDWVRQSQSALTQGDQASSLQFLEQAIRGMSGGQILDLLLQGQRLLRQGRTQDVLALFNVVLPLLQGLMSQIPAESLPNSAETQAMGRVIEPLIKNLPNTPETRPIMDMMQTIFKQLGR
ncbi:hypothetical protein GlitD10_2613 [Gloeomargarita lithophora Alchichica-D10]|uniref:Uncharacterized protein n=1 Tax=Gloeomargarita lithophora Alchichica-D10 TaxID=1188229 RepID=A0A1J0AG75_9CYAN|nr:hypothetical protein [Gloeomargarita lithophora]APB34954.1 hypothetical protein GlitD10_2613 [Gloeomargarita lithophora Alchichica-D10]